MDYALEVDSYGRWHAIQYCIGCGPDSVWNCVQCGSQIINLDEGRAIYRSDTGYASKDIEFVHEACVHSYVNAQPVPATFSFLSLTLFFAVLVKSVF